jgi:hypothetical protein
MQVNWSESFLSLIIFQKSKSHLKIPGARKLVWSKSYTEDPQILGAMVWNLVAWNSSTPSLYSFAANSY